MKVHWKEGGVFTFACGLKRGAWLLSTEDMKLVTCIPCRRRLVTHTELRMLGGSAPPGSWARWMANKRAS